MPGGNGTRCGAGQIPDQEGNGKCNDRQNPEHPLDIACDCERLCDHKRCNESSQAEEGMQSIHERTAGFIMDPKQQGIAAYIQRALGEAQDQDNDQQNPERVGDRYKGNQDSQGDENAGHEAMPRDAVIDPSAEQGAKQIAKGTEKENFADLAERTRSMFGELEKRRSFDATAETQQDKGQVV